MSVKKFVWMFVIGACLSLCSAETASACANDRLSHDTHEHVAQAVKSLPQRPGAPAAVALRSEPEPSTLALRTADAKPATTTKTVKAATTTATLQETFDDGWDLEEEAGSCIHGCSCTGPRSHRRGCGTNGDCHAHEGLICTW
ncbi:MAG: hypothetical protein LC803_02595 [Acidobacteria bacterium]|nr:hypothetical protein [Acidobacteriota bacterium]